MYDAVIIGGGPAGGAAAITLAQRDRKTILLEKGAMPRHKVCGEFFSPGAWPLLEHLGLAEKMLLAGGTKIQNAALYFPGKIPVVLALPSVSPAFPAYGLSRFCFDDLIMRHAKESGCEVRTRTEVLAVREEKGFCSVQISAAETGASELQTRFVVMAAGKSHRFQKIKSHPVISSVARNLGGVSRLCLETTQSVGFKAHFQCAQKPEGLEMYFFPGGYLGIAEVENGQINLCGILNKSLLQECSGNFDQVIRQAAMKHLSLRVWLSRAIRMTPWLSCMTPRGFQGKNAKRIFYAGDAACFVEPMIGQGMTLALASGIQIAENLEKGRIRGPAPIEASPLSIYASQLQTLKWLEPLARICTRFPFVARPLAGIALQEKIIEKLLATPARRQLA